MDKREKRDGQINFRPSSATRKRLADAMNAGFERTEVLNGLVEKYLDDYLRETAKTKVAALQRLIGGSSRN